MRRSNFAVVFGINIVIAIWETVQPFILAGGVDSFAARVPYLDIVAIIVFPVLAIGLLHGIVLPLAGLERHPIAASLGSQYQTSGELRRGSSFSILDDGGRRDHCRPAGRPQKDNSGVALMLGVPDITRG